MNLINKSKELWVIGTGPMAVEYAKVLNDISKSYQFIGRGKESTKDFDLKTGLISIPGGLKNFLQESNETPSHVIISVGVPELAEQAILLLDYGVENILIEKPGALNFEDLIKIHKKAKIRNSNVFIAYNRRFLKSIEEAKKIISSDGGMLSMHFEFTELSHIIQHLQKAKGVKESWLIGNSSHVIDLAFHIAGLPKILNSFSYGKLNWHKSGSIFIGNGITEKNVPFSYHSNWSAPGRWGLEFMTKKYKLILRPMEKLQIIEEGSFDPKEYDADYSIDEKYKPGLFRQTNEFISNEFNQFCSIEEQVENWKLYEKIASYR